VRLELKDIKAGGVKQEYSCALLDFPDLELIAAGGGPEFNLPLKFQLCFQRTGKLVEVDGQFETVVRLRCGRCLQNFDLPLAEQFTFTFVPQTENCETDEEVELEAAELGLTTYRDEVLLLREPLQEQLLMAIPISPLCDDSCRGLCPECGEDLNKTKCDCVKQPFNNKFTVLSNMNLKKS